MANLIVRAASVYLNDQKLAECSEAEITINPRRTDMFGAEGWMGLTRGAITMDVKMSHLVPVDGTQPDFLPDVIAQNDVEFACPIDGKILRITGGYTQSTLRYNTETGRCEGSITINGGSPTVIG